MAQPCSRGKETHGSYASPRLLFGATQINEEVSPEVSRRTIPPILTECECTSGTLVENDQSREGHYEQVPSRLPSCHWSRRDFPSHILGSAPNRIVSGSTFWGRTTRHDEGMPTFVDKSTHCAGRAAASALHSRTKVAGRRRIGQYRR